MKKISLILILVLLLGLVQPLVVARPNDDDLLDEVTEIIEIDESDDVDEASEIDSTEIVGEENDYEAYVPKVAFKVLEVAEIGQAARDSLRRIVAERDIIALVFLVDYYTVRETASFSGNPIVDVPSGHQVQILDVVIGEYNTLWARVSLYHRGASYEGFVERGNLATPDDRFLSWEIEYDIESLAAVGSPRMFTAFSGIAPANFHPDVAQFPASYQLQLAAMKAANPSWTFVRQNTNIDWNWMVAQQMHPGRALVHRNQPAFMWTSPSFEPGWYQATEIALKHHLDPRNFLSTPYIFMFELLSFNQAAHTVAGTQAILNNTFMRGNVGRFANGAARPGVDDTLTYAQAFFNAGRDLGVSPFHLASRVRQEQGVDGVSNSISGNHATFPGVFNYFNWGASPPNAIFNGLQRASNNGWTTRVGSIRGGADLLSRNYIRNTNGAQDTLYLQKFNASGGHIWHQFMTNIMAPRSESRNVFNSYRDIGALGNSFVFKIPVYNNMPATPSFLPASTFNIALVAPAGYTANNTRLFLDGVEFRPTFSNGQFVVNPGVSTKRTATMHLYNANGSPIGMFAWALSFGTNAYTVTALPELRDLITHHGFAIRITGNSGIRFHSGISMNTRNALLTTGVHGFHLREYGTVVMHYAHNATHPLILGGNGTRSGMSFGHQVDTLFAIQDGRGIFTSVLINLPSTQYKTEFLFRGYVILRRNGIDHIFYGPPVARSVYTTANRLLAAGSAAEGSPAYLFLRNIIENAE